MDAFPHLNINVDDQSIYDPIEFLELPLHRPLWPMKTEMGVVGVPQWCPNLAFAKSAFGEATFDPTNKDYYGRSAAFLRETFKNNGAFIVRVGGEDMSTSSVVIWAEINEAGASVDYTTEALADGVTLEDLTSTATKFPLFGYTMKNDGMYGDKFAITIRPNLDDGLVDRNGGLPMYEFGYAKKDKYDTYNLVKTKYSSYTYTFCAVEGNIDPATKLANDHEAIEQLYFDSEYHAPAKVKVFYNEIASFQASLVGTAVVDTDKMSALGGEVSNINVLDGTVLNDAGDFVTVFKGVSLNGTDAAVNIDGEPINMFTSTRQLAFTGGSDGSLDLHASGYWSDNVWDDNGVWNDFTVDGSVDNAGAIELAIANWFNPTSNVNPNTLLDNSRYPYNFIFDPGYSVELKDQIADFLAVREDVKIVSSTWNGTTDQNEAEAIAEGKRQLNNIRATPESELFGTGTFRANIFGQIGKLNDFTLYRGFMPLTFWYAVKLSEMHNGSYIKANPAGLPNAAVDMFNTESFNWVPADKVTKRNMWDDCVNYCQFYDMQHVHFAGVKSVYNKETSVLTGDAFGTMLIYIKQATHPIWAKYSGIEDPDVQSVYSRVMFDLDTKLNHIVAGRYLIDGSMYQTAEEALLGYVHHIALNITGGPTQRVWNLDIIAKRAGFEG